MENTDTNDLQIMLLIAWIRNYCIGHLEHIANNMAASPLKTSEENIEKKMENVSNTQDSVQNLSLWIIHHKSHSKRIVDVWFKVLKKCMKNNETKEI